MKKLLKKAAAALRAARLLFKRYRYYEVFCPRYGSYYYEDPKCPSSWRGSGCYDIEVYTLGVEAYLVSARDAGEARDILFAYYDKEVESAVEYRKKNWPSLARRGDIFLLNDARERVNYGQEPTEIRESRVVLTPEDERGVVAETASLDTIYRSEREDEVEDYDVTTLSRHFGEPFGPTATEPAFINS